MDGFEPSTLALSMLYSTTELHDVLVEPKRFELLTFCVQGRRYYQPSYDPKKFLIASIFDVSPCPYSIKAAIVSFEQPQV